MKKKLGKRFKQNLFFVVAIIILFSAVLFAFLLFNNNTTVEKEILVIEQQKLSRVNDLTLKIFDQITRTNAYFSTVVLRERTYPLLEKDVEWYSNLNARASLCISLMDYINFIKVTNGELSFSSSGAISYNEELPNNKEKFTSVGTLNATDIFIMKDSKNNSLIFRLSPNEGDYAKNESTINVNSSYFGEKIFEKNGDDENLTCIVDASGKLVLSSKFEAMGENLFSCIGIEQSDLKTEKKMLKIKGDKYSYITEKLGDLNLFSVSITNQKAYTNYYNAMGRRTIFFGVILFIVSFLISMVIAYRTYKPIKNIINLINEYMPDSYNEKSIDEIVYLQENIAKLYINNRDLNKAVHDDILILKNQQAIALQSQISPHFIYNTLDAINWKAADLLGRKNPISKCVIDMANVIEYSMDSSTFLAPLREEIEISKKYIDILNQRYNEKLNVKWIVDDTLLDCKVIKICIQPLIENAVFHGISNDIENGKIYIKVHSLNDNLIIEIADNGNGVTEENLNELKEKMDDYKNSPKKHTALRNVNIRIKLLYGENYGLNVKNSPEGGFLCSVSMPIDKIKENYIEE